jgi:hypothetical protein
MNGTVPMLRRRRFKHTKTFKERLAEEAARFKEEADRLPEGSKARDMLLRRARQAETASHVNDWLRSPGLQPPKALENLGVGQKK